MGLFLIWISLSFIAAIVASNKGRSGVSFFFLSLLLSPVIGIIAAAVAKPNVAHLDRQQVADGQMKQCAFCAELVKAEARLCRYCGRDFPAPVAAVPTPPPLGKFPFPRDPPGGFDSR